ncbi:DUF5723 family protein [Pelobium manganitolerans]|uniref:DUF5723 family protein n=1 Tax=Pelobium manganitolerans TaxID=1842495 RepID=UPI003FA36BCB
MKRNTLVLILLLWPTLFYAQNIALSHSSTQFDAFENPVQQGFQKDLSRKYAITLFPHLFVTFAFEGDAETLFKRALYTRKISKSNLPNLGENHLNYFYGNSNIYLFNYRIFRTRNYNRELGFSLQLKEEGSSQISNETFTLLDDFRKFTRPAYTNPFNSSGLNQAYWQLGATYRENYDDRWAFGAKLSLLNGIIYNNFSITQSQLEVTQNTAYNADLTGSYISSFGFEKLKLDRLIPNLKNFGGAISLASSYQHPKGYYFTLNLKDLGFIRWGKNTGHYNFTSHINGSATDSSASKIFDQIKNDAAVTEQKKAFYSKIDSKIEFAASKEFGFYKPVVAFSKSIFNPHGQLALLNNFSKNAFVLGVNPIYDFETKLNLGAQIMVKSPNMEFYVGSEQVFPTYYLAKSYLKQDESVGRGTPRMGAYFGINVKFGSKMQDIGTADEIQGLNDKETGFIYRMSNKERKKAQKQNKQIEKNRRKNDKRNNRRR